MIFIYQSSLSQANTLWGDQKENLVYQNEILKQQNHNNGHLEAAVVVIWCGITTDYHLTTV